MILFITNQYGFYSFVLIDVLFGQQVSYIRRKCDHRFSELKMTSPNAWKKTSALKWHLFLLPSLIFTVMSHDSNSCGLLSVYQLYLLPVADSHSVHSANVTTPQTASRCECGTRTTTSSLV